MDSPLDPAATTHVPSAAPAYRSAIDRVPCGYCGIAATAHELTFSEAGERVCLACASREKISGTELRVANTFIVAAYCALCAAALGLVYNPFGLMSFLAISGGTSVLLGLPREPKYRAFLGKQYLPVMVSAGLGVLGGALDAVLLLLQWLFL
ncbi:MAG: hypothetical protein Q8Q09_19310 [Deltaproteobacteria bacterium]|nr:hypothetical protein [Deltaproteobacteria bacterium]